MNRRSTTSPNQRRGSSHNPDLEGVITFDENGRAHNPDTGEFISNRVVNELSALSTEALDVIRMRRTGGDTTSGEGESAPSSADRALAALAILASGAPVSINTDKGPIVVGVVGSNFNNNDNNSKADGGQVKVKNGGSKSNNKNKTGDSNSKAKGGKGGRSTAKTGKIIINNNIPASAQQPVAPNQQPNPNNPGQQPPVNPNQQPNPGQQQNLNQQPNPGQQQNLNQQPNPGNPNPGAQNHNHNATQQAIMDAAEQQRKIFRDALVDAKVKVETGALFFGRRRKREAALEQARQAMVQSEMTDGMILLQPHFSAIDSDPNLNQIDKDNQKAILLGNHIAGINAQIDAETAAKLAEQQQNLSKPRKILRAVGRWIMGGGSIFSKVKTGAAGAMLGGGAKTAAYFGGAAALPAAAAVGGALGLGLIGAATEHAREQNALAPRTTVGLSQAGKANSVARGVDAASTQAWIDNALQANAKDSIDRWRGQRRRVLGSTATLIAGAGIGWKLAGMAAPTIESHIPGVKSTIDPWIDKLPFGPDGSGSAGALPGGEGAAGGGGGGGELPTFNADQYKYPWNWASQEFGSEHTRELLNRLVENTPGAEWDFNTAKDTDDVIKIFGKSNPREVTQMLAETLAKNPHLGNF